MVTTVIANKIIGKNIIIDEIFRKELLKLWLQVGKLIEYSKNTTIGIEVLQSRLNRLAHDFYYKFKDSDIPVYQLTINTYTRTGIKFDANNDIILPDIFYYPSQNNLTLNFDFILNKDLMWEDVCKELIEITLNQKYKLTLTDIRILKLMVKDEALLYDVPTYHNLINIHKIANLTNISEKWINKRINLMLQHSVLKFNFMINPFFSDYNLFL